MAVTYQQTIVKLEKERIKLARTREFLRDPQLDLDFEHTEDEILVKLCAQHKIRQNINVMYGRTYIDATREQIQIWKLELGELKAKLKGIVRRYSREVFMMLCSVK